MKGSRNKKTSTVLTLNKAELVILVLILLLIGILVFTVVTFSSKVNVKTITKSVDTVQNLIKSIDKTTIQSIKSDIASISTVIDKNKKMIQADFDDISKIIQQIQPDDIKNLKASVTKVETILDNLCTTGFTLATGSLHAAYPTIPSSPLTLKLPCGK